MGLVLVAAVIFFIGAEVTARVYWRACCGVSLLKPDEILYDEYGLPK